MARDLEKVRKVFSKDRFCVKLTGIEIDAVDDGYALCSLQLNDNHRNLFDAVMGGVLYTLSDFAFAVATNEADHYTTTLTGEIRYLSKTKGDRLSAECKVVKNGAKTCFADVVVIDNLGTKVALVSFSGYHVS